MCLLYTLLSNCNCNCNKDGFSIGVPDSIFCEDYPPEVIGTVCQDPAVIDMCPDMCLLSNIVRQSYNYDHMGASFETQITNSLRIYSNDTSDTNEYFVYYNSRFFTLLTSNLGYIEGISPEDLNNNYTRIPPSPPSPPSPSPSPISSGPSSCTPFLTDYNEDILNWSTDQNPYGTPMFDDDTTNYLRQGQCPTCQTYALISCLSCMYNIELYKIHLENNNCGNFTSITISPRSLIDIYYKYKIGDNTYDDDCTISLCRISKFTSDFYQSNSLLMYQYFHNHFNNGRYPLIKNHAVKKSGHNQGNQYMNITGCFRESKNLFDETLESLNNPDFSYISLFDPTDLIYMNYGDVINISEDFNDQIIRSGALDGNGEPRDVVTNRDFIDRLKTELKQGPLILGISVVRGLRTNGLIDIVDPDQQSRAIMHDGAHNLLLIGYENDNAIILNSWNPNLNSDDTPGTLQYYITNDVPLIDIYNDYMNWYDINDNSYPSTTGIFRINITIPESHRQIISESPTPSPTPSPPPPISSPPPASLTTGDLTGSIGNLFSPPPARPPPPPPPAPPPSPTSSSFDEQINNLCNNRFDYTEGQMGGHTYYSMGQIDLSGDGRGRCCISVQDLYDNHPEIIHNASPEIQTNLFNYSAGCDNRGHSDNNPSATNTLNAISCQGIMDDVHCRNGGTLESSPCRCECPHGFTGTNCEKTCDEESPRILPILNRLFESGDLLNEQQHIDVNRYIEYCQE